MGELFKRIPSFIIAAFTLAMLARSVSFTDTGWGNGSVIRQIVIVIATGIVRLNFLQAFAALVECVSIAYAGGGHDLKGGICCAAFIVCGCHSSRIGVQIVDAMVSIGDHVLFCGGWRIVHAVVIAHPHDAVLVIPEVPALHTGQGFSWDFLLRGQNRLAYAALFALGQTGIFICSGYCGKDFLSVREFCNRHLRYENFIACDYAALFAFRQAGFRTGGRYGGDGDQQAEWL